MIPVDYELKALALFVSDDETRAWMNTIWEYSSDGGCTHVATDGHTIAVRRAGKHASAPLWEIEKLPPKALNPRVSGLPPRVFSVVKPPSTEGPLPSVRGINPDYFARVALVERAAGRRAADDYFPKPGESKKSIAASKLSLRNSALATWVIGSDPLDGWYWRIPGEAIFWEGVIMPRRV